MKIKIRQTAAGPDGIFHAGQIVDWPNEKAVMWLNAGAAEPVKESALPIEVAKEEVVTETAEAVEVKRPEAKKRGRK